MKLLFFGLAATLAAPFCRVLPARADDAATHLTLAQTAMGAQDLDKALAELDKALALEPDNIQALTGRSMVCATRKDFAGAVKTLSHLIELDPKNFNALRLRAGMYGQLGDATRGDADFIAFLKGSDAGFREVKAQAQAATDTQKWDQAFKAWDLLAKARPSDPICLFNRGKANVMLHPREMFESDAHAQAEREAAADFAAAVQADPNFTQGIIFQASRTAALFLMEEDLKRGIADITTALARLPQNEDLLSARADLEKQRSLKLYFTDKPTSEALSQAMLADYNRVLQANPRNFVALLGRADALHDTRPDAALADVQNALQQKPDDPDALKLRAALLVSKHDYSGAVADYDRLYALHPTSNLAFQRVLALQNLSDKTRALSEISRLIAADPLTAYYSVRAEIYLAQKEFARALTDIDKALELSPGDVSYAKTRAEIVAAQKVGG